VRILGMFHGYPPAHNAGAEWMAHTMLRHLAGRGHHVEVMLSRPGDDCYIDGVTVRGRWNPPHARRFDVLVTHLDTTVMATKTGLSIRVPVVHLLHNTFLPWKRHALDRGVALLVANSDWMAADYQAWFAGRHHPPLITVRPPVIAADYACAPGDRVTLVNLFGEKGGWLFWRLAGRLPDVPFLGVKGAYGQQVIPPAIPRNADLIDTTPRMRDEVYARTRVLLMPSEYESWGRVGVEAMASGIPVIAHPTPGLLESLGDAGIFVDRGDIDGWATQIRRLHDPDEWAAASSKALARSADLDPTADLDRWAHAVEAVAARRHPS
jgi:hypothetical protein